MSQNASDAAIPFVGRGPELSHLQQILYTVRSSRTPKIVLIQGDFGVGKTALGEHFLGLLAEQDPAILLGRSKCAMEVELNGLTPFRQLFAELALPSARRRDAAATALELVKELAPAWIDVFTAGAASATLTAVTKTVAESGKFLGRESFSQESVFTQFANVLSRIAEKHLVVAFIDDLHWADASSLRLLFHLARFLEHRPILILGTYRPVEALETGTNAELFREIRANLIRHGTTEIELAQGIDVAAYLVQRYPRNVFPPKFSVQLQQRTDGHALFVSQICSLCQETAIITATPAPDGTPVWALSGVAASLTPVPQTLAEVLEQRVRLLSEELRELLVVASVEGDDFTAQVVTRLRNLSETKAFDDLAALEHRYRLIREQASQERGAIIVDFFSFAHRFIREHVYQNLSAGKRRILHRQVAECLEALYSDPTPVATQLALHFKEAHDLSKAAQYALLAARAEQSRYTWAESEAWCHFGLALVPKLAATDQTKLLQLDLLEQSANGYYQSGQYTEADVRYREALALGQQFSAPPARLINICEALIYTNDYEGKLDQIDEFLAQGRLILQQSGLSDQEFHLKMDVAQGLKEVRAGNYALAIETLGRVIASAEQLPRSVAISQLLSDTFHLRAISLSYLNRFAEAEAAYRQAIALASSIGALHEAAGIALDLADDLVMLGRFDEAETMIAQSLHSHQQYGDQDGELYAWYRRARLLIERGQPQAAFETLTRAIAQAEQIGAFWNISMMLADLSIVYISAGHLEEAFRQALKSVEAAQQSGNPIDLGYSYDALAQVEAAQQNWDAASEHFIMAHHHYQNIQSHCFVATVQLHHGAAMLQQGQQGQARELLQAASATFQALGITHLLSKTNVLLKTIEEV